MRATGDEIIHDKHSGQLVPLTQFLTKKANITEISRKLLSEVWHRHKNIEKKNFSKI